jgi:glycosyltransferase involved in cell wall biosynthesis
MTKLLFLGDLANTGFGTVTQDLGRKLLDLGIDVRFSLLEEGETLPDVPEPFASRTALTGIPGGWLDPHDPDARMRFATMFKGGLFEDGWTPDVGLVTADMGSFEMSPLLNFLPPDFPLIHYVPIEGIDLPPIWGAIWQRLIPVAMCRFGAGEIAKVTGSLPPVVYHGVDTKVFHPVDAGHAIRIHAEGGIDVLRSREDCRRLFGGDPDDIWVLRTDRNMPRKNYASLFRAMVQVFAADKRVKLVIHAQTFDQGGNLRHLQSKLGQFADRLILTEAGGTYDRTALSALYNASDIYVSTSAEGFGLTIAEALACGIPAVGMDYSSVPEVIGPAGIVVPPGALIDNIYSYFWARVDEPKFGRAVEELVRDVGKRRLLGAAGPRHIRSIASWATAATEFATIIERVARKAIAA